MVITWQFILSFLKKLKIIKSKGAETQPKNQKSRTRLLSSQPQLPKASNSSSKLPGQTTALQMCLEILHLPRLISFLSWIWIGIMSQLMFSNANEMQTRLAAEVGAVRFGSCSSAWIFNKHRKLSAQLIIYRTQMRLTGTSPRSASPPPQFNQGGKGAPF